MTKRHYSSIAVATTLSGSVSSGAPTLNVVATTGFPVLTPYRLIVDRGTDSEEIVEVTAVASNALTCTRGVDGTSALAHSSGATVEHGVSGGDHQENQDHIYASANVHGITGSVVGTTDTQTISAKTILTSTLDSCVFLTPHIASFLSAQHDHGDADGGGLVPSTSISGINGVAYTPLWTASGITNPTIGNGTIGGRYIQLGKLVFYWWGLIIGSTTTKGVGSYSLSLPVTARTQTLMPIGTARYGGPAAPENENPGQCFPANTTHMTVEFLNPGQAGDSQTWSNTSYPTSQWVAGDTIGGFLVYEAA